MNSTDSRTTFDAYRAAWARHDLDAIVSMHHPEGTFWLHTAGEAVVVGHDSHPCQVRRHARDGA